MANSPALSFSEAQARNQASYDEFPYISHAFSQTHPARIAAIGTLFSLDMPATSTARVLEIGCASGGNIIPLASVYPKGEFLGIDLSSIQIEDGKKRIAALGLTNIELRQQDLSTFEDPGYRFDYIICHGVYSWVSEPVRHAILDICSRYLQPNGAAYVSYNVLPGWRPKQVLRDALMAHVGHSNNQRERIARAREFMAFLHEHAPTNPYGAAVRENVGQLQKATDDYLAHEFLEFDNAPCSFPEFMQLASQHDLAYLGESDINMMVPDNFGPDLATSLRSMSANDLLRTESYIDVLTGRTFRQTLLVAQAHAAKSHRIIDPSRLENLHLIAEITEVASPGPEAPYCFENRGGRQIRLRSEAVRKAFQLMIANRPSTSNVGQLIADLEKNGESLSDQDKKDIRGALLRGVLAGLLIALSDPIVVAPVDSDKPKATRLARKDAVSGRTRSANLRHESVDLGVIAQHVLPVMDGTLGRDELCAYLVKRATAGALHFQRNGQQITDEADIEACAREHLANTIQWLGINALLER